LVVVGRHTSHKAGCGTSEAHRPRPASVADGRSDSNFVKVLMLKDMEMGETA
jgi:hypothetical protein